MKGPAIALVVARADNGIIGRDGGLPWHLPADLRRFKMLTAETPLVMGRKTFDSLPGLLPGRRHIVLTREKGWSADGAEVASTVEQAVRLANAPRISVIGGSDIFHLFADRADRVELTEVHYDAEGDVSLPAFDKAQWREVAREDHPAAADRPAFSFVTLLRA